MRVLTVVGARPQFIKAAVVSPRLREVAEEVLVHTGQHYDRELSAVFFDELELARPDYELGVGSAEAAVQTGRMLEALAPIVAAVRPDWVLVYGDTNSTLAGALAAAQAKVPLAHVEAGLRSYDRTMPEEINRVVADHLATALYCPTPHAVENLRREGIERGVVLSGDVMAVALRRIPPDPEVLARWDLVPGGYYLVTVHRAANTDDRERLGGIVAGLGALPGPVVWPVHPRAQARLSAFALPLPPNLRLIPPVGYRAMITLEGAARAVLTDSGGVQREAAWLGVPVYILREETEWRELLESGQAVLTGTDPARIAAAVQAGAAVGRPAPPTDDPVTAIVEDLRRR
ncbi:MAG: UDP-N-acetylglucosamine 2-epimerase (non-hydrolyzing) [Firmicutes bacterium]|nr:UDP-N-acetylglucosamine 2-epimerase (non-hydrolyzing) [Alicyclobacillaceae bacterium]MCL6496268.1 UDP-N-acetylglucosamine 2-epimerase (non-hydrolyzing) [Bacillota bacterium]